jgi:peptidoglycan hydrolase-like protein with peptidoglycan-binding domain
MKKIALGIFLGLLSMSTVGVAHADSPCISLDKNLTLGMRGEPVNTLQTFLYQQRYLNVEATGYFGQVTLAAVKIFQTENGIPGTGYFGPLSRAKMCGSLPTQPLDSVTYSIKTDKNIYNSNDTVVMTVTAKNDSGFPKTMNFTNGCESHYTIDNSYHSLIGVMCIQALSSKTIPAYGTVSWDMEYDLSRHPLTPGKHTVKAFVENYGSVSTDILVSSATVSRMKVTSPHGGEVWQIGKPVSIIWEDGVGARLPVTITLKQNIVCITTPCTSATYKIAENFSGMLYTWNVAHVPVGNYMLEVCQTDNPHNCNTSDSFITIR